MRCLATTSVQIAQPALLPSAASERLVELNATKTWTGLGSNNNWTNGANWSDGLAPGVGDALVFAGTARITPFNDYPSSTYFKSITFAAGAGARSISGNQIILSTGVITNNSSNIQTINCPINTKWTPAHTTTKCWYDAQDALSITHIANAVSQWNDKSGNNNHLTQATSAQKPTTGVNNINGINAIYFDGSDWLATANNPYGAIITDAYAIFVMNCKSITGSTLFSLSGSDLNSKRWQAHVPWSDGTIYFDVGGINPPNRVSGPSGWVADSNHLASFYNSVGANIQEIRIDGAVFATDQTGNAIQTELNTGLRIGAISTTHDVVDIGECIIIDGSVSVDRQQLFEGYLAWKFGLVANLPGGHAYKLVAPGSLTVNANTAEIILGGIISGSGSLTKTGANQLTVKAASTFTGGTFINQGTVLMDLLASTSLGLGIITINAGVLVLNRIALNNSIVINGGSISATNGFGCSANAGITLNADLAVEVTANCTFSVNGIVSGPFSVYTLVTSADSGVLYLSSLNTYTGTTSARKGSIQANTLNNVGGGASSFGAPTTIANGTIALGNTTNAGKLIYNGLAQSTDRVINLAGTTGGATITQSGASGVLTFTSAMTATGVGAKTVTLQGSSVGAGSLNAIVNAAGGTIVTVVKAGTGTWTLSGVSTYTGPTSITGAGILNVTGTLNAISAITISNGVLRGTGNVGVVSVDGTLSQISGGIGAAGQLTTGQLTFTGVTPKLTVNTDGVNIVSVVNTALTTLNAAVVNFNPAQALVAGTYTVIASSVPILGAATQGTLPPGRAWVSLTVIGNNLVAVLS